MGSLCEYGAENVEGYLSDRNAESTEYLKDHQRNDFCNQCYKN
tara:strand:+ start:46175 stop:46303 length:129 start_codon:yes stop_codon:yes gene_type:complete